MAGRISRMLREADRNAGRREADSMGIGESAQVWEQMDMDAVTGDFERLFPSFSFDAGGTGGYYERTASGGA